MSETDAEQSDPCVDLHREGSGPLLVLIHGLMLSGRMFSTVAPRFAEKHRVICPDLRDFLMGDSQAAANWEGAHSVR